MPGIQQLEQEVKGTDPTDTKAKRYCVARLLEQLIIDRSRSAEERTTAEQKLIDTYEDYASKFLEVHNGEVPEGYRNFQKKIAEYGNDEHFKQESMKKFFSKDWIMSNEKDAEIAKNEKEDKAVNNPNGQKKSEWITAVPGVCILIAAAIFIVLLLAKLNKRDPVFSWKKWNPEKEEGVVLIGKDQYQIKGSTGFIINKEDYSKLAVNYTEIHTERTSILILSDKEGRQQSFKLRDMEVECAEMNMLTVYEVRSQAFPDWWNLGVENHSVRKKFFNPVHISSLFGFNRLYKVLYVVCWLILLILAISPPLFFPAMKIPGNIRMGIGLGDHAQEAYALRDAYNDSISHVRYICAFIAIVLFFAGVMISNYRRTKAKQFIKTFSVPSNKI